MSTGAELLANAKRQRGLDRLPGEEGRSDIPEFLEQVCRFLQEHETTVGNETTHAVYENYLDWWIHQRSTYKLAISEDNTRDQFYRMIAECQEIGLPLTLTERRTPQIKFVQEVDIFGFDNEFVDPMELLDVEGAFLQLIGSIMQELYPNLPQEFLDVMVMDATGRDGKRCVPKTSMRLVWPQIIVDKKRAERIRDFVVHRFNASDNEELVRLSERIMRYNKDNSWNNVFHDSIYSSRDGLRMPYCDKVSPAPLKKPESRPFKPLGVWRIVKEDGQTVCSHKVQPSELEGHEWLTVGCIRQASGTELTQWVEPKMRGERVIRNVKSTTPGHYGTQGTDRSAGTVNSNGNGYNDGGPRGSAGVGAGMESSSGYAAPIGRDPGRVQVRTRGGSDNYASSGRPRRTEPRPTQQREPEQKTVERVFTGTIDEFKQQLIQQIGCEEENFKVDGNSLVFQVDKEDNSRIMFNQATTRVYITGEKEQVRTWVTILSKFVTQVGESAQSIASTRTAATTRPGAARSTAGHTAARSTAPSRVFAPSATGSAARNAATPAATEPAQTSATTAPASGQQAAVAFRCTQDFEAQGQGELTIKLGDIVWVTQDNEGWAYGYVERAPGELGWFPRDFLEATPTREAP